PFMQNISFEGPNGETMQVKALFNEGTMVSVMSTAVFNQVKCRLTNWEPWKKRLQMSHRMIVPSRAKWKGSVAIVNIKTQGEFKVFDSGGGWQFLFGKPLLQAFRVVHEYETDTVRITGEGGSA
ncbi:hypothetical protein P692DRAFT_201669873, partial [Suillus brevipes Sb2]